MDIEKFDGLIKSYNENCTKILTSKGREYQNNTGTKVDVLANFKRGSGLTGIKPTTVLMVYMAKHWDSLSTFIKDIESGKTIQEIEANLSEPIDGRIIDIHNYLYLLSAFVEEMRAENGGKTIQ